MKNVRNLPVILLAFLVISTFAIWGCRKESPLNQQNANVKASETLIEARRANCPTCNTIRRPVNGGATIFQTLLAGTMNFEDFTRDCDNSASTKFKLKWKRASGVSYIQSMANKIVCFDDRSKLGNVLGTDGTPLQPHHIIPWNFCADQACGNATSGGSLHDVVRDAALDGFNPNDLYNGIPLTAVKDGGLHANHPYYNAWIRDELGKFRNQFQMINKRMPSEYDCNKWLQCKLIPEAINRINAVPTGMSLNDYFKTNALWGPNLTLGGGSQSAAKYFIGL